LALRIVFLGTSAFALPALERLAESDFEVVGVYTQPDRPAGRGRRDTPSPVKEMALRLALPVFQPPKLSVAESLDTLKSLKPDVFVAAAYGQILRQPVLDIPPLGVLNIHPSLLPKYRGAAPVAAAILNGDSETGVTIMRMVLALDEGPVLNQRRIAVEPTDTTGTLTQRLAEEGADLLMKTLPPYVEGALEPEPQDASLASYVSMVKKEAGLIDWTMPAERIWRQIRAYNPWPMAHTYLDGTGLQIHEGWPLMADSNQRTGTVLPAPSDVEGPAGEAGFAVQTGEGLLAVLRVQKEGRRAMTAKDFVRGERDFLGRHLG
jgi:methionyl-tRNA formyltransferase